MKLSTTKLGGMNILKKSIALLMVLLFLWAQVSLSQSVQKQNLKVLYVGFDPAIHIPDSLQDNIRITGGGSAERFAREYQTRMPAFKSYLEKYFTL